MECKLTEGLRAYLAQGTLVVLVIGALLFKRSIERPRRPLVVWLMDVSKQAFSACSCHVSNIIFAVIASKGRSNATECSWYFIQYNVDNIIGVTMTILAHRSFVKIAWLFSRNQEESPKGEDEWRLVDALSQCGEYGNPPSCTRWAVQVTEWISSVIAGRAISGTSTVLLRNILWYPLAEGMDNLFMGKPVELVFFVLVLYPLCCGITVAWIQDGVLKLRVQPNHGEPGGGDEDEQPLLSPRSPIGDSSTNGSEDEDPRPDTRIGIRGEAEGSTSEEEQPRGEAIRVDGRAAPPPPGDVDIDSAYSSTLVVKESDGSFLSASSLPSSSSHSSFGPRAQSAAG